MNFLIFTLIGVTTGMLASMGLGGGFILVVYLALFTDIAQKTIQGINLLFFIPITILAVILHIKNKMIDVKTALICSLLGIVSAIIGFYIVQAIDNHWLRKLFAIFIIVSGFKNLFFPNIKRSK